MAALAFHTHMFVGSDFPPQTVASTRRCKHCGKEFKAAARLQNHEEICRARSLLGSEGSDDAVSGEELLAMVRLQRKEIEWLKKELGFAKRGEVKQKKVEILSWLDENIKPETTYLEFIERIQGSVANIETVFDHGYLHATALLVGDSYEANNGSANPLYAFSQKEGQLFCYTGERWRLLTPGMWDQVCILLKKIQMSAFEEWKAREITDIYETKQQNLWLDRMQRLQCLPPYGCPSLANKLKKKIFQHIRMSFKDLSDCLPE